MIYLKLQDLLPIPYIQLAQLLPSNMPTHLRSIITCKFSSSLNLSSCRARLATVTLFQLPVTLRLTTLFHTSYCLPPVSVACYIPLLPAPTSCIYRASRASFNRQSSHTTNT